MHTKTGKKSPTFSQLLSLGKKMSDDYVLLHFLIILNIFYDECVW